MSFPSFIADRALITEIIDIIREQYGYDFSGYAEASFKRRLERFAEVSGIGSGYDLKYRLLNEAAFFGSFLEKITVNVTTMFRDAESFRQLREVVLPVLAAHPVIKIWHAGCATGQEVYSMCILLEEAGLLQRTYVYATDISPGNIKAAKSGIMPQAALKEYTNNYLAAGGIRDFSDYYTANYGNAIINRNLLQKVIFSRHNLVAESSFNEFNLILCRNVMIYFDRQQQDKVIGLLYESLAPGGFLCIGDKESLVFSAFKDRLPRYIKGTKIYRKEMK